MGFVSGLAAGLFIGTMIGVVIMSIMQINRVPDDLR